MKEPDSSTHAKQLMKTKKLYSLLLIIIIASLLTGCGARLATTSWPGISSPDGVVYAAYGTRIYAINGATGGLIWAYPSEPNNARTFFAAPVQSDGLVIAGDYRNTLVALDAASGAERWTFTGASGRWVASPFVVEDTILAPNADHNLYALDMNGNEKWRFATCQALWSQPYSDGETVYQASMDHNLYALDLHDGSLLWSLDLGGAVIYSPTVDEEGTLYVATLGNEVIAVNPEAGSVKWRVQLEHSLWTQPALAEGSLYLGDLDGNVYALSAADGAQRWSQDLGEVSVIGRPTVSGSSVVFATQKNGLFSMTFDGARQWVYPGVNGTLYNGPITSEDRLVVGVVGGDNLLVALEPSGAPAWTFALPE